MADNLLNNTMDMLENIVAPIRSSNAQAMEMENGQQKTLQRKMRTGLLPQGGNKRRREEEAPPAPPQKAPRAAPPPKTTMADVKMEQVKRRSQEQTTKSYLTKFNQLGRFRAHKTLWPWLMEHGDRKILNGPAETEKDLDRILSHIDATCSQNNAADKMKKYIYAACSAFERFTDNGAMLGMNLTGYADDVFCHVEEIEFELEILRCKYGDYFRYACLPVHAGCVDAGSGIRVLLLECPLDGLRRLLVSGQCVKKDGLGGCGVLIEGLHRVDGEEFDHGGHVHDGCCAGLGIALPIDDVHVLLILLHLFRF